MKTTDRFEKVPIDRLVPYARNARTHSKEQVLQLRSSLREFGFVSPIICDKDMNIIAGHGRVLAAKAEGMTEVPCVFVEHLTESQKRAYIIADNKLALNADWDSEMLALEFADLKDFGFDLELTGFDEKEIEKLFAGLGDDVKDDNFDLSAALEQAAFVLPGDIWTLGKVGKDNCHRLMCGDSTKLEDVHRLMNDKKANLCLTDVPYGVNYKSRSGLTIMNDNLKADEFYTFLHSAFCCMESVLDNKGSIYVFHADTEGTVTRRAFEDAGFKLSSCCIWVKNMFVLGRSDYHFAHEPILYGWKKKGKHKWYSDRKQSTVWNFDKPKKNDEHPNQKPLALMAYPIQNSSQANSIVLDLFGGSGSTLIACEQTDRICYMMELDPKYASVILRRYAQFKGKMEDKADIWCERGGERLAFVDLVKEVVSA